MKWISLLVIALFLASCNDTPSIKEKWKVVEVQGEVTLEQVKPTIEFFRKGKLSGNTSCNQFFGDYSLEDMSLSFSKVGSTKKMCSPEISEQELKFFDAFHAVKSIKFEKSALLLLGDKGETLLRLENAK